MYYINLDIDIKEYYNEEGFDYDKFEDEKGLNTLIELHNNVIVEYDLDYGYYIKGMYELDNEFDHRTATEILDIFKYARDYGSNQSFNTQRDYYFEDSDFEYVSVDHENLILALEDLDILTEYKDYILNEY